MLYDPAKPAQPTPRVLGGPIPVDLATDGAAVWHVDVWAPALIKSGLDRHGHLLDWGEKPFDGRCDGIAFDGRRLWALDRQGKRICVIEKAPRPDGTPRPVLLDKAVAAFDTCRSTSPATGTGARGCTRTPSRACTSRCTTSR